MCPRCSSQMLQQPPFESICQTCGHADYSTIAENRSYLTPIEDAELGDAKKIGVVRPRSKSRDTEQNHRTILELSERGYTVKQIAESVDFHKGTIYAVIREQRIKYNDEQKIKTSRF